MIPIVFENERFVIVDKPGGTLSVPSQWGKEDPRPVLSVQLSEQLKARTWPVHRLDFEVTGLVIFAKDEVSHRTANEWFERREIHKFYEAWGEGPLVEGAKADGFLEWTSHIHRGKKRSFESPHGKLAVTRAYWQKSVPSTIGTIQQWVLDPLTGRPHQLRVEMTKHHNIILGDRLYGSQHDFVEGMIALRAIQLNFSNCKGALQMGLPEKLNVPRLESLITDEWKARWTLI